MFIGAFLFQESKAQKLIPLDPGFEQNSERWTTTLSSKKNYKFNEFGPFYVLQTQTAEQAKPKFRLIDIFEVQPLIGGRKEVFSQDFLRITALWKEDTAVAEMIIFVSTFVHRPGYFSNNETEPPKRSADSLFVTMKLPIDTALWTLQAGTLNPRVPGYEINGRLGNGKEEYTIRTLKQFAGKNCALDKSPKGIVITNSTGEELAALQLRSGKYTWFRKSLNPDQNLAMALCFSIILYSLEYY